MQKCVHTVCLSHIYYAYNLPKKNMLEKWIFSPTRVTKLICNNASMGFVTMLNPVTAKSFPPITEKKKHGGKTVIL